MEEQILAVDLSTEQVLEVNLPEQDNVAQIDVYWQDEVTLDLDLSLMYIVSGQREIQDYVDNKSKPEIDDYIETYAKPIVSEVVEEIAAPVVGDYIENTVKPEIKDFADAEMANYAQVAGEQATIATEKASEASETAKMVDEKAQEFSQTTEASKTEFVNFAQEKTEEFAQTAEQATTDSQANVEKSRIWAEGEQAEVEPLGGSLSSMGAADLAYAIANAPEDTPIDTAKMFAMNIFKGEKGDKGDKGDAGKDGKDGDKLPSQEGNAGKFLKTDGENTLWDAVDLSSKANTNLNNISSNIDYVVESYVNGVNWYQKYKSGKIIQGGRIKPSVASASTVNLIKPFANTNYTFLVMGMGYTATSHYAIGETRGTSRTTTSIQITSQYGDSQFNSIDWLAVGQGA